MPIRIGARPIGQLSYPYRTIPTSIPRLSRGATSRPLGTLLLLARDTSNSPPALCDDPRVTLLLLARDTSHSPPALCDDPRGTRPRVLRPYAMTPAGHVR
jgi:hypothetical protein